MSEPARYLQRIRAPVQENLTVPPDIECKWDAAEWICLADNPTPGYPYFLARRAFTLQTIPSSALLHISADLFYRLHLNGEFVGDGPPRNTVVKMSYRSYEIAPLLQEEGNVVAVEVYAAQVQDGLARMALICQLDMFGEAGKRVTSIGSDGEWRMLPGHAWQPRVPRASLVSLSEIYDARNEPQNWKEPAFDSRDWQTAALHDPNQRFQGIEDSYCPHTVLEPSIVPSVRRSETPPKRIQAVGEVIELDAACQWDIGLKMGLEQLEELQTCHIQGEERLLAGDTEPTLIMNAQAYDDRRAFYEYWDQRDDVPCVRHASIVLDFGELMNAFFFLDVEGEGGEIIDIAWAETLIAGRVQPRLYIADRGASHSHADRYALRKGRQQWESFHYQPFRYVQLTFRNMNKPLKLHRFLAVKAEPDFKNRGHFACSDEMIQWCWRASDRTVRLSTYDSFMDDTIREKAIWSGDPSVAVLAALTCYGEEPITQHYLRLFTSHPETDRFINSHGDEWVRKPVDTPRYFCHPLRFAYLLCDYFYYSTDADFLRNELYPVLCAYVDYITGFRNSRGLIENLPGSQWVDWALVDNTRGEGAPQNLLSQLFLAKMVPIARHYGHVSRADAYEQMASAMSGQIYERFWAEAPGLYVDSVVDGCQQKPCVCGTFQLPRAHCGTWQGRQGERILNGLSTSDDRLVRADALFMIFPLQALFAVRRDDLAVEMMRHRYSRMRRAGSDTIWEECSYLMSLRGGRWTARYRACAHSGSSAPAYILSSEVLGVKPRAFRFSEFEVRHRTGDLE